MRMVAIAQRASSVCPRGSVRFDVLQAGAESERSMGRAQAQEGDDRKPSRRGNGRCGAALTAGLEPHDLGTDARRVAGDLGSIAGWAEDVDDVDRLPGLGQRAENRLAEDLATTLTDRDDSLALRLQVERHVIGWSICVGRRADDRDCHRFAVDPQEVVP